MRTRQITSKKIGGSSCCMPRHVLVPLSLITVLLCLGACRAHHAPTGGTSELSHHSTAYQDADFIPLPTARKVMTYRELATYINYTGNKKDDLPADLYSQITHRVRAPNFLGIENSVDSRNDTAQKYLFLLTELPVYTTMLANTQAKKLGAYLSQRQYKNIQTFTAHLLLSKLRFDESTVEDVAKEHAIQRTQALEWEQIVDEAIEAEMTSPSYMPYWCKDKKVDFFTLYTILKSRTSHLKHLKDFFAENNIAPGIPEQDYVTAFSAFVAEHHLSRAQTVYTNMDAQDVRFTNIATHILAANVFRYDLTRLREISDLYITINPAYDFDYVHKTKHDLLRSLKERFKDRN